MAMNTYPLQIPLGFAIDETVIPYLRLMTDKLLGHIPEDIQKLLDEGLFDRAAKSDSETDSELRDILQQNDYDNASMGLESADFLNDKVGFPRTLCCYASEFEGEVQYLDAEGNEVRTRNYDDDDIMVYECAKEPGPFKLAYGSMSEFIDELKDAFACIDMIPDDFDWQGHVVSVVGTYFC